ncbi:nucleoside deaminase [bacterium]|nr:nucleoside deaminase [bacterium]
MKPDFMLEALNIAKTSEEDIPIGAVIVKNNEIISKAVNQREKNKIATKHAEIIAIEEACKKLKNWRMNDCEIYVTLEPCPMCASAILQARIKNIYFGAYDYINGAFGSKCDMRSIMGIEASVRGGIMEEDCTKLLKDYFKELR